ncbi:MAG: hypothetical protein HY775_08485 [Acidobacteria bacterium]|nr:hypothetical protein [Acidobacteriota bacterium]
MLVKVDISGTVSDVRGNPIAGAVVYWTYGLVETDSGGRYRIRVAGDGPVKLTADHALFLWRSVQIDNPLVAQALPQDFRLPHLLGLRLDPDAFNPSAPATIQVETVSTAPREGTKVVAELPSGDAIELSFDSEFGSPNGWRRWIGSFGVAQGSPDGLYSVRACALDALAPSDCDLPEGLRLSQQKADAYAADSLPPEVTSTSPARFADVLELASISATWADATSGVDPASLSLAIDGTPAQASVSGATVSVAGSGIPPGIHLVELSARDLAGNLAQDSFLFTLVTLTASPATAALLEETVEVNPDGSVIPPSQITFHSPRVQVSGFEEELDASTWVGYGKLERPFALGEVEVRFQNETGLATGVLTQVPAASAVHDGVTLSPSAHPLTARIPTAEMALADIAVDVPLGYGTRGSTATLVAKTVPLGPSVSVGAFLGNGLTGRVPVAGTIGVCFSGVRGGSANRVECEVDGSAQVRKGKWAPAYMGVVTAPDRSDEGIVRQECTPSPPSGGCVWWDSWATGLAVTCPTVTLAVEERNLCTGLPPLAGPTEVAWSGRLNAWVYDEPGGSPLWQQNHADDGVMSCPNGQGNGQGGSLTGRTFRLVAGSAALDGSLDAILGGTWSLKPPDGRDTHTKLDVLLGAVSGNSEDAGPTEAAFQVSTANSGLVVLRQGDGYYVRDRAGRVDALGRTTPSASATANGWQLEELTEVPDPTADLGIARRVQITTGTEFRIDPTPETYQLVATLAYQFALDFQCS